MMHPLRKRHSWPPLRKPRSFFAEDNIDQDPFAYFISSSEDRDAFVDNDLTAGIDRKRRAHSLSPNLHKTRTLSLAVAAASSPTMKLKKWIQRMELRCFHRSPPIMQRPMPSPDTPTLSQMPQTVSPPARGRRDFRVGSSRNHNGHGGRRSARPQRVSRAPSGDIWTIAEEGDSKDELGLGIIV